MKYIKLFEAFGDSKIDIESIKSNINDIFQDLIDIDYKIDLNIENTDLLPKYDSYKYEFKLVKQNSSHNDTIDFPVSEIKEYILRMKDYLISEGMWNDEGCVNGDVYIFTLPQVFKSFYEFENIDTDREIYVFNLNFWIHIKK